MITVLPNIIENSAKLFPDKEAFCCGSNSLSYAELEFKTNQLAQVLNDLGVVKGDRIGIYMNRSIESVIAVYGILKSGTAFVPLDPLAPNTRTTHLIKECGIQTIVTNPSQNKKILHLLNSTGNLKNVIGLLAGNSENSFSWETVFSTVLRNNNNPIIDGNDLAYIMFTSGSTGAPKGIMHTHKSALAYAKLSSNLYQLERNDRVANHAPLHFDISTFGYFSAPLASATTVLISDAHTKLPASLAALISHEKITIWYSVPLAIIQLYLSNTLKDYDYPKLRWVLFGGENFTMKYLKAIMDIWSNASFSNVYGPAEVNQCTYFNFNLQTQINNYVPLGKIWSETEYKIIDKNDEDVRRGEIGELLIHSSTKMKGYWKNPDLTNKSFYADQIDAHTTKLFYRTGDLVKLNSTNQLVFLGRNDRQIKLRGYRIELDEIEIILSQHPSILEARVCVIDDENQENVLVAAIVLIKDANVETSGLLKYCKSNLPIYAVPSSVKVLKTLPRTSSDKIDLNAIKEKFITVEI